MCSPQQHPKHLFQERKCLGQHEPSSLRWYPAAHPEICQQQPKCFQISIINEIILKSENWISASTCNDRWTLTVKLICKTETNHYKIPCIRRLRPEALHLRKRRTHHCPPGTTCNSAGIPHTSHWTKRVRPWPAASWQYYFRGRNTAGK